LSSSKKGGKTYLIVMTHDEIYSLVSGFEKIYNLSDKLQRGPQFTIFPLSLRKSHNELA
jgi:hypothetical protein